MSSLGPEGREQMRIAGRVGAIGIELVLSIFLGYFVGRWLDGKLDTRPWLQWVGLVLGLAAGARSLYQLTRKTRSDLDTRDALDSHHGPEDPQSPEDPPNTEAPTDELDPRP